MADIILAEFSGRAWLVHGEDFIDDLLNNTLGPHVSIEVRACESKSAVDALWEANGGGDIAAMWLIHPAIVERARGASIERVTGVSSDPAEGRGFVITFAPWSAAIEPTAAAVIAAAAACHPGAVLRLAYTLPPDAPPMAADMARLRCALITGQLATHGMPAATAEAVEGMPADTITVLS